MLTIINLSPGEVFPKKFLNGYFVWSMFVKCIKREEKKKKEMQEKEIMCC